MRTQHAHAATSPVTPAPSALPLALLLLTAVVAALFAPLLAGSAGQAGAQQPAASPQRDSLATALAALHNSANSSLIPAAEKFAFGDSSIASGRHAAGPVAIANGSLDVRGTIDGDAVSYNGDIRVHQGGEVRGNAFAIRGKVLLDGGVVDGDSRALTGDLRPATAPARVARSPAATTLHSVALAGGWLAMLMIVGIGVLIFAAPNLDAVSDALERSFGGAFLAGIATQLALAPALALVCVGLVLTILGTLLVPFAIVAYILATAGLVTLGYLAIARLTGRIVLGAVDARDASRADKLRALAYGLLLLMIPWLAAGALAWSRTGELLVRIIAVAVTWVAATAGLGAAIVSRGGVRRGAAPGAVRAISTASWATPTPVAGIAAARRPAPFTPAPK